MTVVVRCGYRGAVEAEAEREAIEAGQRIRKARLAQGLSLDELADELECSKGVLSKWENGETESLDARLLERLAARLYVTPRWILFGPQQDAWLARHQPFTAPKKRRRTSKG